MIVQCGSNRFELIFDWRDREFFREENPFTLNGAKFYRSFVEPANASIVSGHYKGHSYERASDLILVLANNFIDELETSADLLEYDYSYSFTDSALVSSGSGGVSGFKINDLFGAVGGKRKGPFLTLVLSESGPNGFAREVQYIDLRNLPSIKTDDWGDLRVKKSRAKFTTLDKIRNLVNFIRTGKDSVLCLTRGSHE